MDEFSAALMAGGNSIRMGRDKTMLLQDGVPLWQRQVSILHTLEPRELFVSGKLRPEWEGFEVVEDEQSGFGPLGGIVSCLHRCTASRLLVLAADMPKMTGEYLRSLLSASNGAIPKIGEFFEPLAAVYPKEALPIAERLLQSRQLSLQTLAAELVHKGLAFAIEVQPTERQLFANWNHPEDCTQP